MKIAKYGVAVTVIVSLLSGCGTFSGLSGSSSFACKAPDGVTCTSMSGIYANIDQLKGGDNVRKQNGSAPEAPGARAAGFYAVSTGAPIMSPTEVMRIWFAPWKDADNDMHDESVVYTVKSAGHWLIEENYKRLEASNKVFSIQGIRKDEDRNKKVSYEE